MIDSASDEQLHRTSLAVQEISRRARLQADELALLAQRLEQLRREIDQHLNSRR